MQRHVTKMIWCEYCRREGWDQVSTWCWDGKAVTRSGVLKVPTNCGSCGDWILAGERVEAIALNLDQTQWFQVGGLGWNAVVRRVNSTRMSSSRMRRVEANDHGRA